MSRRNSLGVRTSAALRALDGEPLEMLAVEHHVRPITVRGWVEDYQAKRGAWFPLGRCDRPAPTLVISAVTAAGLQTQQEIEDEIAKHHRFIRYLQEDLLRVQARYAETN